MKGNLSHNIYSEDNQSTLNKCSNYLLLIGNRAIIVNNITSAIEEASKHKIVVSIFESLSTKGKFYNYLCDVSKGVFYEWIGYNGN